MKLDDGDVSILAALDAGPKPPTSLAEGDDRSVAELRERLDQLADNGLVIPTDDGRYGRTESGRRVLVATGTGRVDERVDTTPAVEATLERLDPGPAVADAVRSAYALLRFRGRATPDDLVDAVYPEAPAGFSDGRSWWRRVGDVLAALPGIEPPADQRDPWRFHGSPEAESEWRERPASLSRANRRSGNGRTASGTSTHGVYPVLGRTRNAAGPEAAPIHGGTTMDRTPQDRWPAGQRQQGGQPQQQSPANTQPDWTTQAWQGQPRAANQRGQQPPQGATTQGANHQPTGGYGQPPRTAGSQQPASQAQYQQQAATVRGGSTPYQQPQQQPPRQQQPPGAAGQYQQQGGAAGPQLEAVRLSDVVETDVVTAQPDTPVATVVAQMAEEDVGSVVIVENGRPVGIVTDRTIALAIEGTENVGDLRVSEVMAEDPVTATTDTTVFDAIKLLGDEDVRRLPVVDENGSLAGIVTLDDVVVLLAAELRNAADVIVSQSPRH